MDAQTLLPLIEQAAKAYGLPARLVRAIVQVESGGRPDVQRHEPAFYERYVDGKPYQTFGLSRQTEGYQRATSYGLMQVMGEVARELGLTDRSIEQALYIPASGLNYGCKRLAQMVKRFSARPDKWMAATSAYNGGPGAVNGVGIYDNPKYVAKVGYELAKLGVRIGGRWEDLG